MRKALRDHGFVETKAEEKLWSERQRKDRNEILWQRDHNREYIPFDGGTFVGLDPLS